MYAKQERGESGIASWMPTFVRMLGVPVWISGPDRRICYLNDKGERLLGCSRDECIGRPCHEVVQGRDSRGEPFCGAECRVLRCLRSGTAITPEVLRIGAPNRRRGWIQLLPVPVWRDALHDAPWLVHCALDARRFHGMESYLARVANRTKAAIAPPREPGNPKLSRREREVMEHLVRDEDLFVIARRLHVSHATVRNHVQHILRKSNTHSIPEAVALWILSGEDGLLGQDRPDEPPSSF